MIARMFKILGYTPFIISLSIACLSHPLRAVAGTTPDVLLAERYLCDAIAAHDSRRAESSLMPDFTLSLVSGSVLSKADFLELLGTSSILMAQPHGQQVHFYGQSTAIVTGLLEELVMLRQNRSFYDMTVPYTDVWILDGQHWRQAAADGFFWPLTVNADLSA